MYLRNSGFAPHRRQGGFIQGAILFALVIIAVVVAAFSLANRDNQTSASSEQAKVNATYVLKVGTDIQGAITRAIADGAPPATANTAIAFSNISTVNAVGLWDPQLAYLVSEPTFPATATFNGTSTTLTWGWGAQTAVSGVGGTNLEQIMTAAGVSLDVCRRINNTVNGVLVTATMPSSLALATGNNWREGCFGPATAGQSHTYFRVVVVDAVAASTPG